MELLVLGDTQEGPPSLMAGLWRPRDKAVSRGRSRWSRWVRPITLGLHTETRSQGSESTDPVMCEALSQSSASPSEEQKRDQEVPTEPFGVRLPEAKWGSRPSSRGNTPTLNSFPPSLRITEYSFYQPRKPSSSSRLGLALKQRKRKSATLKHEPAGEGS